MIANPLLWFLQHQMWNLPERPVIDAATMRAWDRGYVPLNEAFGEAVLRQVPRGDREPRIMLHDYHLYLAARTIREARPKALLSHFTHIPWPPSSMWQVMAPQIRESIVAGLAANDVVGFHTARYAHNFLRTAESFLPGATVDYRSGTVTLADGHVAHARHYPISIDVEATRRIATSQRARRRAGPAAAPRARQGAGAGGSPGAVEEPAARLRRLRGAAAALPALPRRGHLPRVPGPVADRAREYGQYAREVQATIDRINARFSRHGHRPIQIFYENDYAQALAGLSIADVVLVNPLVDGMNLVAKEAAVVSERNAVLVLSETAGAFDQMAGGVLPVAPADVVGTADALRTALEMPAAERAERLAGLRGRGRGARTSAGGCATSSTDLADDREAASGAPAARQALSSASSNATTASGSGSAASAAAITAAGTSPWPPTARIAAVRPSDARSSAAARNMSRSVTSSPSTISPRRPWRCHQLRERRCPCRRPPPGGARCSSGPRARRFPDAATRQGR